MATKILMKNSTTGGSSPLIGDLDQGELAVNLVDRRIFTKDSSNTIRELTGAYVDSVAPPNPVEGTLWYDTAANVLKAYNGSAFTVAGITTLAGLDDTTISGVADNDLLAWDASATKFTNQTPAEAGFATVATSGSYNDLSATPTIPAAANDAAITLSAGVGLSGGGAFTTNQSGIETITFTVDLNELTSSTDNVHGDFFVVVSDGGAQRKLDKPSITLSGFDNDVGFLTAEADTLTTVTSRGSTTPTAMTITNATVSTTDATGALVVTGGVGIGGSVNVGGDVIVTGNLTVDGTTTTVNSNEVNIGDAIILLNSDEVGVPSQNAGFEVERGTSANVSFLWDETSDAWDMGNYNLQNVIMDGGTY
jgi:hypothetical protein